MAKEKMIKMNVFFYENEMEIIKRERKKEGKKNRTEIGHSTYVRSIVVKHFEERKLI